MSDEGYVPDPSDPFYSLYVNKPKTHVTAAGHERITFRQDPEGVLVTSSNGAKILARQSDKVRKFGTHVHSSEGRAQDFAHSLGVPVPAVHDIASSDKEASITMDFVEGECLEEAWPLMDPEQKLDIAEQVRTIIATMRNAAPNQTSIGSLGGPVRDCRQYSDYTGGPFESESLFNEFVLDFHGNTPHVVRRSISEALRKNTHPRRIVFSHCDLSPRNILLKGGRVQALLHWEYAGWYPEYWEFVKFSKPYKLQRLETIRGANIRNVLSGQTVGLPGPRAMAETMICYSSTSFASLTASTIPSTLVSCISCDIKPKFLNSFSAFLTQVWQLYSMSTLSMRTLVRSACTIWVEVAPTAKNPTSIFLAKLCDSQGSALSLHSNVKSPGEPMACTIHAGDPSAKFSQSAVWR